MASSPAATLKEDETLNTPTQDAAVNNLIEGVARVSVQDGDSGDTSTSKSERVSSQLLRVYTRSQVLYLRDSPLVKPPEGMPSMKEWFGDWNDQQASAKKDNEPPSALANGRERRFRRDVEDSDPSRPSFRSGLSQPSQMGNFRHQSLRTNDRDKDRDSERERERDLRDREGQERLRHLSDKYDRERLAMSSSVSGLRGKERDGAPHLASAAPARAGQVQGSSLAARRAEGRDPSKRKIGESSEDWRRGQDTRPGKDGGSDTLRRDRDGRDRARSRARDTSRPRRETSTKRDRDERDKDRDRTRDRRGDDRDDSRRERDDHRRGGEWDEFHNRGDRDREDLYPRGDRYRPRDAERDADDDPRRWRDDGKRDERLAARRERDRWDRHEERDRERPSEDSRPRRGAARDRRGANADEGKDREDRREKEAEPAWMETYVPTTPGGGILGGQGADGELDGIQAWKKGMKEKERQESEAATKAADDAKSTPASGPQSDGQLDEIQLFRLMMKRDAGKKESEQHQKENAAPPPVPEQSLSTIGSSAAAMNAPSQSVVDETQAIINRAHADGVSLAKAVTADGSQPLLSVLMSATTETVASTSSNRPTSVHSQPEGSRIFASRASTTLLPPPSVAAPAPLSNSSSIDALSNASTPSTFNPPTGSRLLAFGSRAPPGPVGPEHIPSKNITPLESPTSQFVPPGIPGLMPQKASMNPSAAHPNMMSEAGYANEPHFQHNGRHNLFEGVRMQRSFSPHSNMSQASGQFDDLHDIQMLGQMAEMRRASAADRAGLGLANDVGPPYGEIGPLDVNGIPGGPNHAANKMSRLSRLMDQKTREGPPPANRKMPAMPAFSPNPQMPDPRQANAMLNGGMNGNTDARTMEDIFAMLQSSAQDHRASPQIPSGRIPSGGSPFGHSPADLLQQQIHQHQHYQQSNHLDSLYDSRMDDRFVPDGMVPGLRPALPRSRSREPSGVLFNEQLDDPLHFNARLQQQRNLDLYPTSVPNMYSQQPTMLRNGGLPMQQQQQQFRGNPSPMSNQNMLGGAPQRLPPGLANLGGRPPHDPSQYLGGPIGGMGGGIPGGIHAAQALQQAGYNNLGGGALGGAGLGGFGGGPQLRGPAPQNPLNVNSLNSMANLGLHNNLDLRAANQAQLLGMQGVMPGGLGGGLRGQPGYVPQHGPGQLPSQMSMRQQQQQQQLPSHLMPHMLPPHLSQQQGLPGGTAQGTQDLMALLLGGHRE